MTDCPKCGVSFDEVPPKACYTHKEYYRNLQPVFEDDFKTLVQKVSDNG